MEFREKYKKYLLGLRRKAKDLGFSSFKEYLANRVAMSVKEIAKELNEKEQKFVIFHKKYIEYLQIVEKDILQNADTDYAS